MNYRTAHRSGTSKFQSHGSMAAPRKHASHPRRTARLFRFVGYVLFVLAGLGGLAFAMQQSQMTPDQALNSDLYPSYRGNAWAMLQVHGR